MAATTPPPLAGIRVIDLTIWIQGPVATTLMADLGADVIKIEKAGSGDFTRHISTAFGVLMKQPNGENMLWSLYNRNKRGLALDLHRPESRPVFERLVKSADVLVTNLMAPALRSMGADEESVRAMNPDIIYARGTGLGETGPLAEEPCMDTLGFAYSGAMFTVSADEGQPHYPPGALADMLSGATLAMGVLAELVARRGGAPAAPVASSQLNAMLWLQTINIGAITNLGTPIPPVHRSRPAYATFNTYACGDGRWLALGISVAQEDQWPVLCEALGRPSLAEDPRFKTVDGQKEHAAELTVILEELFAAQPLDYWLSRLRPHGIWASPVNRLEDLPTDPQVVANNYVREDTSGTKFVPPPFVIGDYVPPAVAAPAHGAHTDEILGELGLSDEEISALRVSGAVW